jgi:hypothetical protein
MLNLNYVLVFELRGKADMANLERKDVLRIAKEKKVRFVRLW